MSDTATATGTETPADGNGRKTRSVDYTLEIVDGPLPDRRTAASSALEDNLKKIVGAWDDEATRARLLDENDEAKWVRIGSYEHSTAAGAAANVMRQRHGGNVQAEGWEFASRRTDEGDKTGLFARYDPRKVVPGAREQWAKHEDERKAKLAAAKAERDAAKASGEGTATPTPVPTPTPPQG